MPPSVIITDLAKADLREIVAYYLRRGDEDSEDDALAVQKGAAIATEIYQIARNPMVGLTVRGAGPQYRYWYVLKRKYKVYFERLGPGSIRVLRIYGSSRKPLQLDEIIGSN